MNGTRDLRHSRRRSRLLQYYHALGLILHSYLEKEARRGLYGLGQCERDRGMCPGLPYRTRGRLLCLDFGMVMLPAMCGKPSATPLRLSWRGITVVPSQPSSMTIF